MQEETIETLGRRLTGAAVDLGLSYDLGLPPNVSTVTLCEPGAYVLLSATHALTGQDIVSLGDLAADPLITSDRLQSWQYTLDLFLNQCLTPPSEARPAPLSCSAFVANGFGVAVCWTRPYGDRSYDGMPLVCKPISDPLPLQRIVLVYDARQRLSMTASAFVEAANIWFMTQRAFASQSR